MFYEVYFTKRVSMPVPVVPVCLCLYVCVCPTYLLEY